MKISWLKLLSEKKSKSLQEVFTSTE